MSHATSRGAGIDPRGVLAFVDALERDSSIEPHGLIVQRHGRRVVEGHWAPHTGETPRLVYSLSKTFTGTALGLMIGERRVSLDDLVSDHLPVHLGGADERTRRIRVRHLASLATGHDRETILEALANDPDDPVRGFFQIPPDAEPGSRFAYNQPPVLALATVLQARAGERLVDYLRPRLLEPIGIADLRWARARSGVDLGFSGVYTTLDAVARLGQLHLDDGVWKGRRILPAGWVADASARQVDNPSEPEVDWRQGYGFLLWRSRHGYRGDGAFGQLMVVLPEHDAVIAMFSCTEAMQTVLDLIWRHLLPAMVDDVERSRHDQEELASRLAGLALPTAVERRGGSAPIATTATFSRAPLTTSHHTVSAVRTTGSTMVIFEGDRSFEIPLTADWTLVEPRLATSAARLDDGRVVVDLAFVATPHRLELELDAGTGTFVARWPLPPLFGAGLPSELHAMRELPD